MKTTDNSRADALTDEQREAIKKSAFLLEIFAGHDSGANLRHHFGADWHKHAKAHAAMLRAILATSPVEQHEAAPALTYEVVEKLARKIGLHIEAFDHTEGNDLLDFARACVKAAPLEGTGNGADERAAWFSAVMNAAASLEDAANWLTDPDSKRITEGAAAFARKRANELWNARAPRTEVAGAVSTHDAKGLEIVAGWLDRDGLIEPAAMLRRIASTARLLSADAAAAPADERAAFEQWWNDNTTWPVTSKNIALHAWQARAAASQPAEAAGKEVGKIVLFGPDLKEVAWTKGKMPPIGATLYTAPPAQVATRQTLTEALRQAREELSNVEWENDPPARVTDLFSKIDTLLEGAKQ